MKQRRVRRRRVVVGVVILVGGMAAGVWDAAFFGEFRVERPVAEVLLAAPEPHDLWRASYEGKNPDPLSKWGLEEQRTRGWQRPDEPGSWPRPGGRGASETVYRFSSPSWADLVFREDIPRKKYAEKFSEFTVPVRGFTPRERPAGADEVRYMCEPEGAVRSGCSVWWVWLRYGQYVVEISVEPMSEWERDIPDHVYGVVRDVDRSMTAQAPRD